MTEVKVQGAFNVRTYRIPFPALRWVPKGYRLRIRMKQNESVVSFFSPTPQAQKECCSVPKQSRRKSKGDKILLRRCDHRPTLLHISPQECTAEMGNGSGLKWSSSCAPKRQGEGGMYIYSKPQGISTNNFLREITSKTVKDNQMHRK